MSQWQTFYEIVGTAGAKLNGIQFVSRRDVICGHEIENGGKRTI